MDSMDKRPKLRKMDMRFGTWNVRSLYKAGSSTIVAKEYQNLMGVQKVRWNRGDTKPADGYTYFLVRGMRMMN
jgi:hypothetical protein